MCVMDLGGEMTWICWGSGLSCLRYAASSTRFHCAFKLCRLPQRVCGSAHSFLEGLVPFHTLRVSPYSRGKRHDDTLKQAVSCVLRKVHATIPLAQALQRSTVASAPRPVSPWIAWVAAAAAVPVVIVVAGHARPNVLEGMGAVVQEVAAARAAAAGALLLRLLLRLLLLRLLRLEHVPAPLTQVEGCAGIPAGRALVPAARRSRSGGTTFRRRVALLAHVARAGAGWAQLCTTGCLPTAAIPCTAGPQGPLTCAPRRRVVPPGPQPLASVVDGAVAL